MSDETETLAVSLICEMGRHDECCGWTADRALCDCEHHWTMCFIEDRPVNVLTCTYCASDTSCGAA